MKHQLPLAASLLLAATTCHAATLLCVPGDQKTWVREIRINPDKQSVVLKIRTSEVIDPDTGAIDGPTKVVNATWENTPDGQYTAAYAFNLVEPDGSFVNMFKLFNPMGEWRLIDAGVIHDGSHFMLRAVEPAKTFKCKKE